jgi:hypothetical protein
MVGGVGILTHSVAALAMNEMVLDTEQEEDGAVGSYIILQTQTPEDRGGAVQGHRQLCGHVEPFLAGCQAGLIQLSASENSRHHARAASSVHHRVEIIVGDEIPNLIKVPRRFRMEVVAAHEPYGDRRLALFSRKRAMTSSPGMGFTLPLSKSS